LQDSGALPIEMDVSDLNMGDVIDIYPHEVPLVMGGLEPSRV
jgi:aconitate hydratase 2/2-methylisocitrate dehydratase